MILLALAYLFSVDPARASVLFTEESCDSMFLLGTEFVELELAGARWQGGDSPCLPSLHLKTMPSRKFKPSQDPGLLDPEYLLEGKRKARVKVKRLPDDLLEVSYSYPGTRLGKDATISDRMVLKLNFGKTREDSGCALIQTPPRHFVMRKSCVRD